MDGRLVGDTVDSRAKASMNPPSSSGSTVSDTNRLQYDIGDAERESAREQLIFDHRRSETGCETEFTYGMVKLAGDACSGCGGYIYDRYLLQVGDQIWHVDCLRCSACGLTLNQLPSCYVRDDRIHCRTCYQRYFGVKCARCSRTIQSTDWVRRARQFVYHLACFACDSCKRQLSTGEEFALQESSVLCKQHYMELLEGDSGKAHAKQKTKRVRTTFSEEQLQILQANFQVDSNPDGQDLERIAQMTGLSKRVTQVWFQNSRARQKKYQGMKVKNALSSAGSTNGMDTSGCCSQENSIDIDCDDDELDSMRRSPSTSPRPRMNVTFMSGGTSNENQLRMDEEENINKSTVQSGSTGQLAMLGGMHPNAYSNY